MQNMLRDIKKKADNAGKLGFKIEESMWAATARTYSDTQTVEVRAVMKSLYSAFNRKNYDELRALWLPDESSEMTLPGHEKAVRSIVILSFDVIFGLFGVHDMLCSSFNMMAIV